MFDELLVRGSEAAREPALRQAMRLVEALAGSSDEALRAETRAFAASGLSRQHAEDVVEVSGAFQVINRLADALEFTSFTEEFLRRAGPLRFHMRYG